MARQPLVLVTGASGYIGMHCVSRLLEQGYRVRGTVRTLEKAGRVRDIFADTPKVDERLTFAVADLTADDGWASAMDGCDFVLHVASPIAAGGANTEDDFVRPALDGTRRVLKAAADAGVQRVVQTSSVAAIINPVDAGGGVVWDETYWADPTDPRVGYYARSKTLAERAAWEIAEARGFELAVINPVFVIGPVFDGRFSPSIEIIRKLLRRDFPGTPPLGFNLVDVRDVASAHITAMTHADAPGERFVCSTDFLWIREIAEILNENFGTEGYRVPTLPLPGWLMRIVALWDVEVKAVVDDVGKRPAFSNKKLRHMLNWEPISIEQSVIDTARSLIDTEVVR